MPVTEGQYVATSLVSHAQVAYDQFSVEEKGGRVIVRSKHTALGNANVPIQFVEFQLNSQWHPEKLDIRAAGASVLVTFDQQQAVMKVSHQSQEQSFVFPASRERAYFVLSGGLYFPLHIVRRLNFEAAGPQLFDVVPQGSCEVVPGPVIEENGKPLKTFEMRLRVGSVEDLVTLVVNNDSDLVQYRTRNQRLMVQLEA